MIAIDVTALLFPGAYFYTHTLFPEGVERRVYECAPRTYWVVEVFPSFTAGAVYKACSDGLYAHKPVFLEQPLTEPDPGHQKGNPELAVPAQVQEGPLIVLLEDEIDGEPLKVELQARREQWRGDPCIVLTSVARGAALAPLHSQRGQNAGLTSATQGGEKVQIEQWWCEGVGMVKQVFLEPQGGVMELVRRETL